MPETIIAGYARTPFAKFLGQLAQTPSTELGAHAAKHALEKAGVARPRSTRVVVGQVLQATVGPEPAAPDRGRRRHPDDRARARRSTPCASPAPRRSSPATA